MGVAVKINERTTAKMAKVHLDELIAGASSNDDEWITLDEWPDPEPESLDSSFLVPREDTLPPPAPDAF